MITQFKIFESKQLKYWKVILEEPYFSISLDKLNVPDKDKDLIFYPSALNAFRNRVNPPHPIFIMKGKGKNTMRKWTPSEWTWIHLADEHIIKKQGFEYQGEIPITEEDIEEWNLKNDAKKYNL